MLKPWSEGDEEKEEKVICSFLIYWHFSLEILVVKPLTVLMYKNLKPYNAQSIK